jgi:hypothetical protein
MYLKIIIVKHKGGKWNESTKTSIPIPSFRIPQGDPIIEN